MKVIIFCLLIGVAFAFPNQKFDDKELKNESPTGTPGRPRPPTSTP